MNEIVGVDTKERSVLKGWLGPGKAEVLVPGPAVVLCCGSSKLDHQPMVSAFPPLPCPVILFLADIILPCVSPSGHGK